MAGTGWRGFPPTIAVLAKRYFVPFVLPGEAVAATLREQKPGFVRAQLDGILTPLPGASIPDAPTFSAVADATISTLTTNISLRSKLPS